MCFPNASSRQSVPRFPTDLTIREDKRTGWSVQSSFSEDLAMLLSGTGPGFDSLGPQR